jgi:hypothetical protein
MPPGIMVVGLVVRTPIRTILTTNVQIRMRGTIYKKMRFADEDAEVGHYIFFMASFIFDARVIA